MYTSLPFLDESWYEVKVPDFFFDRVTNIYKQIVVTDQRFFDLFKKYNGNNKNEIKMKRPNQLMEVLELAREILHEQQVRFDSSVKIFF